ARISRCDALAAGLGRCLHHDQGFDRLHVRPEFSFRRYGGGSRLHAAKPDRRWNPWHLANLQHDRRTGHSAKGGSKRGANWTSARLRSGVGRCCRGDHGCQCGGNISLWRWPARSRCRYRSRRRRRRSAARRSVQERQHLFAKWFIALLACQSTQAEPAVKVRSLGRPGGSRTPQSQVAMPNAQEILRNTVPQRQPVPTRRTTNPTRLFVDRDRLAWWWFLFAGAVLIAAALDRYHLVNAFKQRERVVIIDPAQTF